MLDLIAFDADDTLWHTEGLYSDAQERFKALLAQYVSHSTIDEHLLEVETRNMPTFGYGIKGFTLSMIETAIELTEGRIVGHDIQKVIDLAKGMFHAEVKLLDYVESTLTTLARTHPLMIITKGDLFDQETKVARSGLAGYFKHIEILSDKTPKSYAALLARYMQPPERFLMVGNSMRSDVLPVLAIGGQAVYIPYAITWAHEVVREMPADLPAFHELASMRELPGLIEALENGSGR